ncbi:MAG: RNA pyrophosphohydrolase [Rhodospirillales bacterium]
MAKKKSGKAKFSKPKPFADRPYRKGVGAVILNADGLVFTARRKDTADAWQLPQGGIDKGEDPADAVLREVEEETGITSLSLLAQTPDWIAYDLPANLADCLWKGRYRGQKQLWYAFRFTGEDGEIDLDSSGHPEFDAWEWRPLASLPTSIVGFKRDLYQALVEAFRHLVG